MKHQVIPVDFTEREFADLYDQVPLWSAPFGQLMLENAQMRFGFMPAWVHVVDEADLDEIFDELEKRLNALAEQQGGLRLTIPMLCVVASKQ